MTFHKASSSIAKTVMTHKRLFIYNTFLQSIRPVRILNGEPEGIQQEVLGRIAVLLSNLGIGKVFRALSSY
jgi:hypothetical protein